MLHEHLGRTLNWIMLMLILSPWGSSSKAFKNIISLRGSSDYIRTIVMTQGMDEGHIAF